MNTYVKTGDSRFVAIRASRAEVRRLDAIQTGKWVIVPATAKLRREARINVLVPTLRILADGRVGYL